MRQPQPQFACTCLTACGFLDYRRVDFNIWSATLGTIFSASILGVLLILGRNYPFSAPYATQLSLTWKYLKVSPGRKGHEMLLFESPWQFKWSRKADRDLQPCQAKTDSIASSVAKHPRRRMNSRAEARYFSKRLLFLRISFVFASNPEQQQLVKSQIMAGDVLTFRWPVQFR